MIDIKDTFLKLTEYTIPFGEESSLEKFLPTGVKKDKWGNYSISIGKSKTMFTCHLDTYCKKKEKVNHLFKDNYIYTDGTTILGGDNKAGVTAILYMISENVPGTYYFFAGEEPILSGGCHGSSMLKRLNSTFVKSFDRAIAFDRKKRGSIITRQMAQPCCSDVFADSLIDEFSKQGVQMEKDKTGYYTDSGNLIEFIPECTNISIGVWNEHYKNEFVDIDYVEKIAKAACNIDWDSLPVSRIAKYYLEEEDEDTSAVVKKYDKFFNKMSDEKIFGYINTIMDEEGYLSLNRKKFSSGKEMVFNQWFEESPIRVVVKNGVVTINGIGIPMKRGKELKNIKSYMKKILTPES